MFPNIKIVEAIRKEYPAGTRVRLVKMDDIQAPPLGTEGTVVGVDDTGSLLMHWDNGSHLNIVYGSDEVELEAKTWVCIDPDTCQWRRQVGGTRYELYDIFEAPNGTYFVVHGEVDPTELDPDDYDQLLEAYSGLLDSANCESERWALIAEAQFETEELSMERERFSTFEGAERAIWKKVGANVSDENSATETRLDAIRKLDKFHLAVFLNDVHSSAKDFPSNNMSWCDWLNKPDDGHLLDVKTAR